MPKIALDRRIQKTLQHLQNALSELIAEKHYDDITIQEILDRANVGRSTFYAHFENKDQLLRSILIDVNELFEEGLKYIADEDKTFEANSAHMPLRVLQFVAQNRRLFKAMLGRRSLSRGDNPLHDYLYRVTWEHFRSMIQFKHGDTPVLEIVAHAYSSAFIGVLIWWLENDAAYSAEQLAHVINQLTLPGLKEIFG
jgi:AcrR family transcriptional regulator